MDDSIKEAHHSFAHVTGLYGREEDKEITHPHLYKTHCARKEKRFLDLYRAHKGLP